MKIPIWSPAAFVLLAVAACTPSDAPSTLDPNPKTGGPCGNGDYGCTLCRAPDGHAFGCWGGYSCDGDGCIKDSIEVAAAKRKDAGAEGGR